MGAILNLKQIHKKVKIVDAVEKKLEGDEVENTEAKKAYQRLSYDMTVDLIKFQSAAKLASRDLTFTGLDEEQLDKLSKWQQDTEFLLKRFELEGDLTSEGLRFLGYNISDKKPYPFIAKITNLSLDPITGKVLDITYIIGELTLQGKSWNLEEKWEYDSETKKYSVTRQLPVDSSVKQMPALPEEYMREEELDYIQGYPFFNNISHKSDIENVKQLIEDKGTFVYHLLEKFEYLSPKLFNKSSVMDGNEKDINKKMKWKTFFNITSRAGQFQQPLTVFNPTLPNSVIQQTIEFYDDQIFMFSLASRPTDSGKQAQTNNLEQSLKNELANNYIEFKKNLRESQFTKYMKLIAKELSIATDDYKFKVEIELTMTQQRQLDPSIDGQAASGSPANPPAASEGKK